MQRTAPYAIIETLKSSIVGQGCTRRISCAFTALNECFIATVRLRSAKCGKWQRRAALSHQGLLANIVCAF